MKYLLILIAALCLFSDDADATCTTQTSSQFIEGIAYTGSCTDDNEVVIQTTNMLLYDACTLMSTTGAVDVFVSLDGTNYATTALSLVDGGATDNNPVAVTAALRVYYFAAKFRLIRVLQNGATDAAASLHCWTY